MKKIIPILVIFLVGCGESHRSEEFEIDSLNNQFDVLINNYNMNTADSIGPLIERNIELRRKLLYK